MSSSAAARAPQRWGIEHIVVGSAGPWTAEGLATLAAAIPALQEGGS